MQSYSLIRFKGFNELSPWQGQLRLIGSEGHWKQRPVDTRAFQFFLGTLIVKLPENHSFLRQNFIFVRIFFKLIFHRSIPFFRNLSTESPTTVLRGKNPRDARWLTGSECWLTELRFFLFFDRGEVSDGRWITVTWSNLPRRCATDRGQCPITPVTFERRTAVTGQYPWHRAYDDENGGLASSEFLPSSSSSLHFPPFSQISNKTCLFILLLQTEKYPGVSML